MNRIEAADVRVDNVQGIYDNPYLTGGAIRLTHLPTGFMVLEETHRSQIVNRDLAFAKLEMMLCERELEKMKAERDVEAASRRQPAYQHRVFTWAITCFGLGVAHNALERNHRFLEEALELVQSLGCTRDEAHQLVDYTFNRPVGEPGQEVGGVMTTLAALCGCNGLDMSELAETELERVWVKIDQIRLKQASKPKHSPLPEGEGVVSHHES